ncbi:hypothetical protein [Candidatus Enterovibrio altilux]|uniref:hypothetical protein n=1 Tax=Candidatus Enterovibrio altilux TaxID=1927128 RepID=UPI001CC23AF5|nr:hypothetical protein [Candidatus Enterovibrio luxaltus]
MVLVSEHSMRGGTKILIYSPNRPSLFARAVVSFAKNNLNVYDAQIMISKDGFTLDIFVILDARNNVISSRSPCRD